MLTHSPGFGHYVGRINTSNADGQEGVEMYTVTNFRTKRAVKEAVMLWATKDGPAVTYYQPGPFGGNEPATGTVYLEGPHYPEAHRWYARATVEDGKIIRVQ